MSTLSILLLVASVSAAVILLIMVTSGRRKIDELGGDLERQRAESDRDRQNWAERQAQLEAENQRLARWQIVEDADAKASEILSSAHAALARATAEAESSLANSRQRASEILAKASAEAESSLATSRERAAAHLATATAEAASVTALARESAKRAKEKAEALLDSSTLQAGKIVEAANKRAEEIAGSAYEAKNNAAMYEQTARAMKNLIEGYGDQYIVPARSMLDDLAEEFGYAEAGEELKKARERSRLMIRNGTAATCDYVEVNRRTTAINFVLDAFDGKIDSVLSRVRHDNVGTLTQEIRDAFTLVNFNGKAFRDARIREEYLAARLDELKWAATAQQLKLDDREEQKRIKDLIREEEKARRDFERAIRDAAKEQDLLKKAMEKAEQQVRQASAEDKARYEEQLRELTERLRLAEERNQRALSMAQQTKRGHVYIISNVGSFGESVFKIGLTRRLEPLDRVRELGDSSVPFEFDVHALIFSEDAPGLEHQLHKHFLMMQMNKVNYRKEFFRVDLKHVREEVEKFGLEAKWTMTAQAREYRETMAIEKAIEGNPAAREAWINRQLILEACADDVGDLTEATADD